MKNLILSFILLFPTFYSHAQVHFIPAFSGNGQDHMNISVATATLSGINLEAGDEIAAFDGSICCGIVVLKKPISFIDFTSYGAIAASKADAGLSNGYTPGNTITYKFWDSSASKEYSGIVAEYLDPKTGNTISAPTYTIGGLAIVKLSFSAVNQTPVANAGADQIVNEGVLVTLDGTGSTDPDGNTLTYLWTVPAGITLSSATASKPSFTAPEVTADADYTFSLVVNDGSVNSTSDNVKITVKQVNKVPNANAGADQIVNEGVLVTLDGTGSADADGNTLTYLWTAPAGVTLSSATASKPTFTAPEVTADADYTFSLVVNDGSVNSTSDNIKITVKQVNKAPTANAGADKTVISGTLLTLDGTGSTDPDAEVLTYSWTAPAGITLSSNTASKPTFTAPSVDVITTYKFSLIVNDGKINSSIDEVTISVKPANKVPTANAGTDQIVNEGVLVTLDGTGSTDPDGDALTYSWTTPAGITLSSATASKPTFTAPEVTADTDYTFSLVVNDGSVNSTSDNVKITVKQVNKAPTANAGVDQIVNEGLLVTLDGTGSADTDGNTLTYLWTAPAGVTLSSATASKPTFTAPEVTADADYTFSLVVNDGSVNSTSDNVKITVKQVNKVPNANAGADQIVNEGVLVTLDGTGSTDPDGDILTYSWTAPAGITLSSATASKPAFTAPEVTADTDYTFSLVVNDGSVNSNSVSVKISVKNNPNVGSFEKESKFKVFPNPTSGIISLITGPDLNHSEITLLNYAGQELIKMKIKEELILNLSEFADGVYYVRLKKSDNISTTKILLKKN